MNYDNYKIEEVQVAKKYKHYVYAEGKVIGEFDNRLEMETFRCNWRTDNKCKVHSRPAVDSIWVNEEEYVAARKANRDNAVEAFSRFERDLLSEYGMRKGLTQHPKAGELLILAQEWAEDVGYDDSNKFSTIEEYFEKLVRLVR